MSVANSSKMCTFKLEQATQGHAQMGTDQSSLHRVQTKRNFRDLIKANARDLSSKFGLLESPAMLLLLLLCDSASTCGFSNEQGTVWPHGVGVVDKVAEQWNPPRLMLWISQGERASLGALLHCSCCFCAALRHRCCALLCFPGCLLSLFFPRSQP